MGRSDDLKEKLKSLIRLAERPGSPAEGELAREMATRLSMKYSIPCKFTSKLLKKKKKDSTPPTPNNPASPQSSADINFQQWVASLASLGWTVSGSSQTKVGPQLQFRKAGWNSEIRVTQRRQGDGREFEAEHVMQPDTDQTGRDWSYTTWIGVTLSDLLRHVSYTADI